MTEPRYRAAPPEVLHVETLGELTAIFDRRSMQTHLVVQPLPEILSVMAAESCDAATVARRLDAAFDLESASDAASIVAERLAELSAMGLVAKA